MRQHQRDNRQDHHTAKSDRQDFFLAQSRFQNLDMRVWDVVTFLAPHLGHRHQCNCCAASGISLCEPKDRQTSYTILSVYTIRRLRMFPSIPNSFRYEACCCCCCMLLRWKMLPRTAINRHWQTDCLSFCHPNGWMWKTYPATTVAVNGHILRFA